MATITPNVVNSPKETMTSKGGYLRLTITSITDSDATTNKRYIGCKLTIEGTRWVGLYRWASTLGGQTVSTETRTVEDWYPGHVLGTKNLTFDNDSAGNLSLTAYIKHIFYKGSGSWNTSYAKSITETLVCSQLPRYATFTSHSATSTLNTITVSYSADANYTGQQYSLDGGAWTNCAAGSYTLSGFTPGSTHTIKTRIYRSDSGLETQSSQISISLKSLPTSNNVSNVNFNSSGVSITGSISSTDNLSSWYIKVKDNTTTIIDGSTDTSTSTSKTWTTTSAAATSMLNRHGSNNSWTLTIEFYVTASNGTVYQLTSKTCTCTLPSGTYLPTYNSSNLSYAVQDSESNNITGSNQKVIKGISDVRISTTQASPQGGASMASYTATSGTKSGTSTSTSGTYIDLSNVDGNSFSVQATDTRGRSTTASKSYTTYIDYFVPYINSGGINISRVDGVTANLSISISGKYMNWSNLSTTNTITQVSVQYKLRSSSSWTTLSGFNLSISTSSGNFTASGTTTGNVFNISNEYDIKITLKDKLKNVEAQGIIYTANVLLWKDLSNHRLGIGKKPATTLDVNGKINGIEYTIYDNSLAPWYLYRKVIDLTSSTYNVNTYYPVYTNTNIPYGSLHRIIQAIQLNSGVKPSWSSHNSGFTSIVDVLSLAGGWGTTDGTTIILKDYHSFISSGKACWYQQLTNSSKGCFYLRGGGKYYLYTDWLTDWTICTSSTTVSSQTIAPTTTASNTTGNSLAFLSDIPTVPTVNNATLTIQKNGSTVKTFTANASSNVTANITVPTKYSDLTDDVPLNVLSARPSADVTISATGFTKLTINTQIFKNGSNLSIANGGIKIGSGITKVFVSGSIYFSASTNAGDSLRIAIYKNSELVAENFARAGTTGTYEHRIIIPYPITVAQNDYIYLYYSNSTGARGKISSIKEDTFLIVQEIR